MLTRPRGVNFMAFFVRFISTCLSLKLSPISVSGSDSYESTSGTRLKLYLILSTEVVWNRIAVFCISHWASNIDLMKSSVSIGQNGQSFRTNLPDSMTFKSSTS